MEEKTEHTTSSEKKATGRNRCITMVAKHLWCANDHDMKSIYRREAAQRPAKSTSKLAWGEHSSLENGLP